MPIDVIKLDRGFFNESTYTNKGETIVASIIKMAKNLEINVVCEGIETEEQLNFVKKSRLSYSARIFAFKTNYSREI